MRKILRAIWTFLRFAVPWAVRFGRAVLGLIGTTAVTLWGGIPKKVDIMANDWLDRAYRAGAPGDMTTALYYTFSAVGYVLLILGWVLLAFITVWILYLIF